VALFFLRLGTVAFGGPAAHIAMMEDEVVTRRKWVPRQRFLDLFAAANLIPAFLMVLALAWAYVRYGKLSAAEGILYGVKPVLIPILAQAPWRLGRSSVQDATLAPAGLLALVPAPFSTASTSAPSPSLLPSVGSLAVLR